MRNAALHHQLETFTVEASGRLSAELAAGAEMPFEIDEERGGRTSLYCYRPLTGLFIDKHAPVLSTLASWGVAETRLTASDALPIYLREQGLSRVPTQGRGRRPERSWSPSWVGCSPGAVTSDSSRRTSRRRTRTSSGLCTRGTARPPSSPPCSASRSMPDTTELVLGDGLSLIRGDLVSDAPADAVWGDGEEPNVLALLTVDQERSARPPVSVARTRFRRILTALRLFERGGYSIGPVAWARTEAGSWRPVPIGASGRPRFLTLIRAAQEDELRAFCDLVTRRLPRGGELSWALSRFEMGCERVAPFEALTDYLLALRALLEPEGPGSGRLAQRLAVICARPDDRAGLAERTARAVSLEQAVISGLAPAGPGLDALVEELSEHLRAILRDALCGHLDADLRGVADELLAEAAAEPAR